MIGLANRALRRSIVLLIVGLTVVGCGGRPAASSAGVGPGLTDPKGILARSFTVLNDAPTFHLAGTLTATLNAALTNSGTDSAIDLKGTALSADADVPNQRATL